MNHVCKYEINESNSICFEFTYHYLSRGIALIDDNKIFVVALVYSTDLSVVDSSRASIDFASQEISWIHSVSWNDDSSTDCTSFYAPILVQNSSEPRIYTIETRI